MNGKVIITVAPTGGFLRRAHHPHVPTQPEQIAEDVYRCFNAGAGMASLHARRADDEATCDEAVYRRMNELIRERCDVVINNSTGGGVNGDMVVRSKDDPGRGVLDWQARLRGLDGGADVCTLDAITAYACGPFGELLMDTPPSCARQLAELMREKGIKPEWEVFSSTHLLQDVATLIGEGFDDAPHLINVVLGVDRTFQGALPYTPAILQHLVDLLPPNAVWCATVCGDQQLRGAAHALVLGGHVRVGIEDRPFDTDGRPLTNVEQVERIVRIVRELGLEPATPAESRSILGMQSSAKRTAEHAV